MTICDLSMYTHTITEESQPRNQWQRVCGCAFWWASSSLTYKNGETHFGTTIVWYNIIFYNSYTQISVQPQSYFYRSYFRKCAHQRTSTLKLTVYRARTSHYDVHTSCSLVGGVLSLGLCTSILTMSRANFGGLRRNPDCLLEIWGRIWRTVQECSVVSNLLLQINFRMNTTITYLPFLTVMHSLLKQNSVVLLTISLR